MGQPKTLTRLLLTMGLVIPLWVGCGKPPPPPIPEEQIDKLELQLDEGTTTSPESGSPGDGSRTTSESSPPSGQTPPDKSTESDEPAKPSTGDGSPGR